MEATAQRGIRGALDGRRRSERAASRGWPFENQDRSFSAIALTSRLQRYPSPLSPYDYASQAQREEGTRREHLHRPKALVQPQSPPTQSAPRLHFSNRNIAPPWPSTNIPTPVIKVYQNPRHSKLAMIYLRKDFMRNAHRLSIGVAAIAVAVACGMGLSDRDATQTQVPVLTEHRPLGTGTSTRQLGEDCTTRGAGDCQSSICLHHGSRPSSGYICSSACDSEHECPTGWRCASIHQGLNSRFCIPPSGWTPKATVARMKG